MPRRKQPTPARYRLEYTATYECYPTEPGDEDDVVPMLRIIGNAYDDRELSGRAAYPDPIGTLRAILIQDLGLYDDETLFGAVDAESGDLARVFAALDSAGLLPFDGPESLFFLDIVELDPAHRGRDLGLELARGALRVFGRECRFAILEPVPQGFDLPPDAPPPPAFERARERLSRHWARLGFARLPGSHHMVSDLVGWREDLAPAGR
jgi:hypothetical protein